MFMDCTVKCKCMHVGVSSQVPYTSMAGMSVSKVLPAVRDAYSAVERYQLVGAYGIQHRMISAEGRPEIVLEGSYDGLTWKVRRRMWKWFPCYNNLHNATVVSTKCLLFPQGSFKEKVKVYSQWTDVFLSCCRK